MKVSNQGRIVPNGVALSQDLRLLILGDLEKSIVAESLPKGTITRVARDYKVHRVTVSNIWKKYLLSGSVISKDTSQKRGRRALQEEDIEFIHFLKVEEPTMQNIEIRDNLFEYSNVTKISESTISRIISKDLNMSYKRLTAYHPNKFVDRNLEYTQQFIDFVFAQDPSKLKFMDEAGIKHIHGNKVYGHAPVGKRAVTVSKFINSQNNTLSLLLGMHGVCYAKFIPGASNTAEFIQFFAEAVEANTEDGIPGLLPGDIIIVDNASIHRNDAELILYNYFDRMNIQYVFLPPYSPDFNPVEKAFNMIKTLLKTPQFTNLIACDLHVAVLYAVGMITPVHCEGFFKTTEIINL